jgi:GDP-L-fucose synthase
MGYWEGKRVLVTGGHGFIGTHVVHVLMTACGVPLRQIVVPRSSACDLRSFEQCERVVRDCQVVIHLAAVTGGIAFSRAHPATQYYDSTLIDLNVIEAARRAGVAKVVAIGNLFAYAETAPMPLREPQLFDGLPTDAHRGVGWLKRNLAVLADLYHREHGLAMVVVYAANAYGPGDSSDPVRAHVIPSTIMKCLSGNALTVWGDGSPTRDFLYVRDVARGLVLAAERLEAPACVNLGSGIEISIRQMVEAVVRHTGFRGQIGYDHSKSGGDARRVADSSKAAALMGFTPEWNFDDGMAMTVAWYREALKHHGGMTHA